MTAEEPGKDEELVAEASSAELSPTESAETAATADAATEQTTGAEDGAASAEAEPVNGANQPTEDSSEPETAPAEESPVAEAVAEETAAEDATAEDTVAEVAIAEEVAAEDVAAEDAPAEEVAAEVVTADEAIAEDATAEVVTAEDAPAEEVAAEQAPAEQEPAEEEAKYQRGKVYQGTISSTTPTAVYVDLGDGDQGVVPGRELELMTRKMLESLVAGAEIDVYVVNPRNHRGEIVLSINHALEELDWRNAEKYAKNKKVYEASVGGYNKGGLIVRFGRLRGFVPQSQLSEDRSKNMSGETPEERYGPMVNKPIAVKVMEVHRHRNRLILSERAATRQVRQRRKEALIAELKVGDIRRGKVVSLENFGAFVDIGGGEGLVHRTELVWGHITHPRQAVNIGDEFEVKVISIDPKEKRIGLSRRQIMSDPWDEIATSLRRGQLVRGKVTKLTKFGAFAQLLDYDSVEGLIHISELSAERVTHPREVVQRGKELTLRIINIDISDRRLGLSLKSVNSTEYLDLDWEMALQESASLPQASGNSDEQSDKDAEKGEDSAEKGEESAEQREESTEE